MRIKPHEIILVFIVSLVFVGGANLLAFTGRLSPIISPTAVGDLDCSQYSTSSHGSEQFQKYQKCLMSDPCVLCASIDNLPSEYELNIGWPVGFASDALGREPFSLRLQTAIILAVDFIVVPIVMSIALLGFLGLIRRTTKQRKPSQVKVAQVSTPSYVERFLATFANHFRTEPRRFSILVYILYMTLPLYIFVAVGVTYTLLGYYNLTSDHSNGVSEILVFGGLSVFFIGVAMWVIVSNQRGTLLKKFPEIFHRYFLIPAMLLVLAIVNNTLGPSDGVEGVLNDYVAIVYFVAVAITLMVITIWRLFKEVK